MKVRIGIGAGQTPLTAPDLAGVVAAIDASGFDSLWVSEVLTGPGPDPLMTVATAAHLHPRKRFGVTLILPGQHHLRLAKQLASLDVLIGGRLLLTFVPGLAQGRERDAVGVPVADRGAEMDVLLPKLRRWWAGEEVDGVRVVPTPLQSPLEMWTAGIAPAALRRCGRFADGWLGAFCTPDEAAAARAAIERAAADAGREVDPEHFGMSVGYGYAPVDPEALAQRTRGRDVDPRELVPVGLDELRTLLEAHIERGISKFVIRPPESAVAESWEAELRRLADAVGDLQT